MCGRYGSQGHGLSASRRRQKGFGSIRRWTVLELTERGARIYLEVRRGQTCGANRVRGSRQMRVRGEVLPASQFPVGRLVKADYDSAERVMTFLVPSLSRKEQRTYSLQLDCQTAEISCPCEAFGQFREASRSPYRRSEHGVYAEQVARGKVGPMITRKKAGLCPHCQRVRTFLQRHKLWGAILAIEAVAESSLDAMEKKTA